MIHKLDKYDLILEEKGFGFKGQSNLDVEVENDTDTDTLTGLMNDLGISMSEDSSYKLLIWNDEVNDMLHVVLALYEICKLDNEDSMKIMMEAHEKGKAVAKSGSKEDMNSMKVLLNSRGIEATVEN